MTIQLGDTAPDFTAEITEGKVGLHEYLGDGWAFSSPTQPTSPRVHHRAGRFRPAER